MRALVDTFCSLFDRHPCLLTLHSSQDREVLRELESSEAAFKNFLIPRTVGRRPGDVLLEKADEDIKQTIHFVHKALKTPDEGIIARFYKNRGRFDVCYFWIISSSF